MAGDRERRVNASRIGLRRRDFRDRDLEWRDEDDLEDDDDWGTGGVYSKGDPKVVVTVGERDVGVGKVGKLKDGV